MALYKITGGDNRVYGPASEAEVRRWIAEGRLNGQSLIQPEGSTEWRPLSTFPEFQETLAPQAPAAATPPVPGPNALPSDLLTRDYVLDSSSCVSRSWRLLQTNFGLMVGGVALYLLLEVVLSVLGQIPVLGWVVSVASLVVTGPLLGGVYMFVLRMLRGQPATVGDIFCGFQLAFGQLLLGYVVPVLLTGLAALPGAALLGIPISRMVQHHAPDPLLIALAVLGFFLTLIPLIYLGTAWVFTLPLIVDKRLDFWSAMSTSRKVVNRHWWPVFGLLMLVSLINLAGFLACCIGLFVAFPLGLGALMYAYEDLFSLSSAPAA